MKKKYYTEEEKKKAKREASLRNYYKHKQEKLEKGKERYKLNKDKALEHLKCYNKTPMGRAVYLLGGYNRMDKNANRNKGDLTAKWIVENIFTQPCAHCGKTGWDVIGCNRLDNSLPHTMDNVEPCCKECNSSLANRGKKRRSIQVQKIDISTGEVIEEYNSYRDAANANNYSDSSICDCCNGKLKQAYGFIWKKIKN